jgi:hypothetical protein
MAYLKKTKATMFQLLTYDNHYLKSQCNDLKQMVKTLQNNVSDLNDFILSHYDISFNLLENIRIITYDCSDNVLSCIHSDSSGNFIKCSDMSDNIIPCVINPNLQLNQTSKTHITDASRCFPYGYPYGYPYYGYPYYPYLNGDDYYYNRGVDAKDIIHPNTNNINLNNTRMNQQLYDKQLTNSNSIHNLPGTHIHIHR